MVHKLFDQPAYHHHHDHDDEDTASDDGNVDAHDEEDGDSGDENGKDVPDGQADDLIVVCDDTNGFRRVITQSHARAKVTMVDMSSQRAKREPIRTCLY